MRRYLVDDLTGWGVFVMPVRLPSSWVPSALSRLLNSLECILLLPQQQLRFNGSIYACIAYAWHLACKISFGGKGWYRCIIQLSILSGWGVEVDMGMDVACGGIGDSDALCMSQELSAC